MLNHSSSQTVQQGTVLSTQPKLAIQPKIRRISIFPQINTLFLVSFMFITVLMLNSTTPAQVTFTDATHAGGFKTHAKLPAGGTWGDYDNDGDVDLFIFTGGNTGKRLFRNDGKGSRVSFVDVTESAGLYHKRGDLVLDDVAKDGTTAIFLDFDNDGNLDIFIAGNGSQFGDVLYRNNGDGTFEDTSKAAGMVPRAMGYFGAISFDYDNDGLLDIYCAKSVSGGIDLVYHNEGNGRFKGIAPVQAGFNGPINADGIVLGDYDNDGDLDLYITSINTGGVIGNGLLRNEGNGKYTDVAKQAGVDSKGFDKNGVFWDYNNDGNLDLLIYSWPTRAAGKFTTLYRNNGDGTFANVTQSVGIELLNVDSSGANVGDYDNDGWLDLCITYHNAPTLLYHNNKNGTFS